LLGDFFRAKVLKYEKKINEIISIAVGELVLEDMIKKVKEEWIPKEFETSRYQNRIDLIKGWD